MNYKIDFHFFSESFFLVYLSRFPLVLTVIIWNFIKVPFLNKLMRKKIPGNSFIFLPHVAHMAELSCHLFDHNLHFFSSRNFISWRHFLAYQALFYSVDSLACWAWCACLPSWNLVLRKKSPKRILSISSHHWWYLFCSLLES